MFREYVTARPICEIKKWIHPKRRVSGSHLQGCVCRDDGGVRLMARLLKIFALGASSRTNYTFLQRYPCDNDEIPFLPCRSSHSSGCDRRCRAACAVWHSGRVGRMLSRTDPDDVSFVARHVPLIPLLPCFFPIQWCGRGVPSERRL
jgi:hypothetical protein